MSKRESHDATGFYSRFSLPTISDDVDVRPSSVVDEIFHADARSMDEVAPNSVALVVTSPPYFAGKEYEEALGEGHIPGTYIEYLQMIHDVFERCVEKLEPGGRMAVNVANLGRKPYRSLASDIISLLQDRLGLLLRGEIVWQKARGAGGSCAWGSFQSPANPVLRDVTERIIVASKGRFDRALSRQVRSRQGLPSEASIFKDDFMEATLDLWDIPPESATRVGHPAPFPVDLPKRLIELYTYRNDLILDPFIGSGSTAVAALRTGRHYVGYDTNVAYVGAARQRLEQERAALELAGDDPVDRVAITALARPSRPEDPFHLRALREGAGVRDVVHALLRDAGFREIAADKRYAPGIEVSFVAEDAAGEMWLFEVAGALTTPRSGLRRAEILWRTLGKASVLGGLGVDTTRLVLITPELPAPGSPGDVALAAVADKSFRAALELLDPAALAWLTRCASGAPV